MKGIWKWILPILIVAIVVAGTYYWMNPNFLGESNETEPEVDEEIEQAREQAKEDVTEEEIEEYQKEGKNPFGQKREQSELNEAYYREYIHGMSHQKVKANKKWGFYLITQERIDWLLNGLDEISINNEDIYRDILTRWSNGDFSQADEDHNTIWRMQNGTVGEAYGVMSEEEEAAYIEQVREGSGDR
ncbi:MULTISPECIES: DUF6241 domain-containing protein [Allobacillus]|uniref:Host cell surface-exposed lipoprotein n=1 Tax=Allobacillus halotolerans TaxID=570278 RepID=A0ABS6GR17_9BACI|nr:MULTISPECIES: DUF6241 domain-containing protein [Allobacillus]MBU6081555.1 hypothetical protein [Allobacillus halotolerans]TSJ61249.1 hypothetical protein FPQ10_12465 [Allobacillus sp. SKP2-8]